ncbi:MAG: pyrimidine dimer DNA glycosylase/endonuclease V [Gemmatimonadota bacterium]|nr:pyrimidine dimer DNA glycosylase/endonuclease V [Gemmatimonadota bacterium]MDH5758890.1 pyrimidine dimer DNA glycosylase/endonuclease V [Gemmatimonadota bacterium]
MRLWSIHPSYLDARGLVALWREGLLARAVIRGATRGYRNHPQLERFRAHPSPISAVDHYLRSVVQEADTRGYSFDRRKIGPVRDGSLLTVTSGQLEFELTHLEAKLRRRSPADLYRLPQDGPPRTHPLFVVVSGPAEPWERGGPDAAPG